MPARKKSIKQRRGRPKRAVPGSMHDIFSHLPRKTEEAIDLLRAAAHGGNLTAEAFLRGWDALKPRERGAYLPYLETFCRLHRVDAHQIVGIVVTQYSLKQGAIASLIAAYNLPDLVAASAAWGKEENGARDREMIFQQQGFLQRTPAISIDARQQTANVVAAGSRALPSFEEIMRMGARAPRELTAGEAQSQVQEAEVVDARET